MSIDSLKHEVRDLLIQADDKVRTAVKTMATGSDEQRVRATGQLVFLRRRRQELEERLNDLERCQDNAAHAVGEWIIEDWMILMHRLETWIEAEC
jgi:hypothetical protein